MPSMHDAPPESATPTPYYSDEFVTLYHGRCEDILPQLAPESVDVLLVDPPYFQVKEDEWDRQWKKRDEFLTWLGGTLDAALPALVPSASAWVFASAALASEVERTIAERFRVLNSIRWVKEAGWHQKADIEAQRRYLTAWEGVILAERLDDAWAAADYEGHKAAHLPVGRRLAQSREAVGLSRDDVASALFRAGIYASLESAKANVSLQEIGSQMLSDRTYEAWSSVVPLIPLAELRDEYEAAQQRHADLRWAYDHLRRPFKLNRSGPVTDVWNFKPVMGYAGKHPCEKPLAMLDHMLAVSARPGATVLDYCAGSGSTLRAAKDRGLNAIGIEMDERWCKHAAQRLTQDVLDFGGVA